MSGVRVPAPPPLPPFRARLRRLEPSLRRAFRGPCALPPGSRVLVALSGGADSTALLLGLHRIAPELGFGLSAAHLHHGLRGTEADADLRFVRGLCARLGVPLAAARWDTKRRMKARGLSGQDGLRRLRREFLTAAARRAGAQAIATAHTADDQLETVLLRLLRGAGLPGLGGMSARRGVWLKPLLDVSRDEIERDLTAVGQSWREDGSNRDLGYARNRVRHGVVPALLEALAPGHPVTLRARAALARRVSFAAREARDARRALEEVAVRALKTSAGASPPDGSRSRSRRGEFALDSHLARSYPPAIQRTLLRLLWRRSGDLRTGLTHRHLEALRGLIVTRRGRSRVALPGGWSAELEGGLIRVLPARAAGPRPATAASRKVHGVSEGATGVRPRGAAALNVPHLHRGEPRPGRRAALGPRPGHRSRRGIPDPTGAS